jgi:hypothetical protein
VSNRRLTPINTAALSSAPASPRAGDVFLNTANGLLYYYNGTGWIAAGSSSASNTVPPLTWSNVKNGVSLVTRVIPPLSWSDVKNGLTI